MKKEQEQYLKQSLLNVYQGILFNYDLSYQETNDIIKYKFDCPSYSEIVKKYNIDKIIGKGSDFIKCKRLLHYLATRLTHSSFYDNHVPCNALDLLAYSLNNPEHGINCLNKAKILVECLLAVGIKARRVSLMPFSPYDMDNHVVVEAYLKELNKWVMLDPTLDGYFINEDKTPLSILEIRERFANDLFLTFTCCMSRNKDLKKLQNKYLDVNSYICKNMFYFMIEKEQRFGECNDLYIIAPRDYKINKNKIMNCDYRINNLSDEYREYIAPIKKLKERLLLQEDVVLTSAKIMIE